MRKQGERHVSSLFRTLSAGLARFWRRRCVAKSLIHTMIHSRNRRSDMDGTDTQIGAHARGGGLPHAHSYNSTMAAVQQQQRADLVLFLPERAERESQSKTEDARE